MKKYVALMLVLCIAFTAMSCAFAEAELLRTALCPECGEPMVVIVYCSSEDQQHGTYTQTRDHLDHTDYRYVSNATRAYACYDCGVIDPIGVVRTYSEWICDLI